MQIFASLDPTNVWVKFCVHVIVGSLSAGLTNVIAIRLLFWPRKKILGFQGAIPKNHVRLARSIGKMVGERLVTGDDFRLELQRPDLQEQFETIIYSYLPSAMGKLRSRVAKAITPKIWEKIQEELPRFVHSIDLQAMVEKKITMFSVSRVEELMRDVLQNEFNMIILSGFMLGAIIGVGTFAMSMLLGL